MPHNAAPTLVGRRIGEIVVALGFATEADVDSAVEEARQTGRATGRVLYDRGTINKNQLAQAIAARTQISYIDLRILELEERALNAIDGNTAGRYRAVPIQYIDDDTLLVAISRAVQRAGGRRHRADDRPECARGADHRGAARGAALTAQPRRRRKATASHSRRRAAVAVRANTAKPRTTPRRRTCSSRS